MNTKKGYISELFPGILVSVGIMILSINVAKLIPGLGGATYAILLGILLGNTVFKQKQLNKGTAFSEKRLLEVSVFLLGYSISVESFAQIGFSGLFIIIFMLVTTMIFVMWRGRAHGVSKGMAQLLASGNAICGSSAIAAVSDVVDVSDQERSNSIVLINLSGTILMLLLPVIGGLVFKDNALQNGLLIGSIVQSVGQVAGAGSQMGPEVLEIAMITKIIRVMLLVFVVLYFSTQSAEKSEGKQKISKFIPWYIIGFVVLFMIRLLFGVNNEALSVAKSIGNYFELTALSAIGLRLNLKVLIQNSKSLLTYIFETLIFQVGISIAMILIVFQFFVR